MVKAKDSRSCVIQALVSISPATAAPKQRFQFLYLPWRRDQSLDQNRRASNCHSRLALAGQEALRLAQILPDRNFSCSLPSTESRCSRKAPSSSSWSIPTTYLQETICSRSMWSNHRSTPGVTTSSQPGSMLTHCYVTCIVQIRNPTD